MKLSLIITLITSSFTSGILMAAVTAKDSWETIRKSKEVNILEANLPIDVFNACVTNDEIKSINPVKKCPPDDEDITKCETFDLDDVAFARDYKEYQCIKFDTSDTSNGDCLKYKAVDKMYPESYKLNVLATTGELEGQHLFYKTYTLPACE